MDDRVPVFVLAHDPVSQVGIAGQLRANRGVRLVDETDPDAPCVAVVVADEVDAETACQAKALLRNGCSRVVMVLTRVDDGGLLAAVEAGASGVVRRSEATSERLLVAVQAAVVGNGTMPPDLLGRLLDQVGRLQRQVLAPRGIAVSGLANREVEVLRLVADGYDTAEIASKLSYSERTVKNVIHDITTRLQLRNRSHAVAYAVRQGLI